MSNYSTISKAFVAGEAIKSSWRSRVRAGKDGTYGWAGQGPLYSQPGTVRLDVVSAEAGYSRLVSYGHFDLAVRKADGQLILNGDNAPTVTSRKQQRELRSSLGGRQACLLPFSALEAARVEPSDVNIVATTSDRQIVKWKACKCDKSWHQQESEYIRLLGDGTHERKHVAHFLGETLFTVGGLVREAQYFVCGLDRNDDPSKRHFYLARLPEGAAPTTVDEALETLKPPGLPEEGWLRQGEWFFVPRPDVKAKVDEKNILVKETHVGYQGLKPGVPIITANVDRVRDMYWDSWEVRSRARRHRATRMYVNGAVYVSGMVRDEEHTPLKLGNGKTWYQVVRNLSEGSWAAGGKVD